MISRTTDGEGTRRTRSAPGTESPGGGYPVMKKWEGGKFQFGKAIGVAVEVLARGEREEDGAVRREDAGHVPVRGISPFIHKSLYFLFKDLKESWSYECCGLYVNVLIPSNVCRRSGAAATSAAARRRSTTSSTTKRLLFIIGVHRHCQPCVRSRFRLFQESESGGEGETSASSRSPRAA